MSTRKPIKEVLIDHKAAIAVVAVLIVGGSIGAYFIYDYLTATSETEITLATTSSTYDSGLLGYILPYFKEETGITVNIVSLGTSKAIAAGERGDADVILVHARDLEDEFINYSSGTPYGIHRACVMYNYFVIVGPLDNPAGLLPGDNITTVMTKLWKSISESQNCSFISRYDGSGTYVKELALWTNISVTEEMLNQTSKDYDTYVKLDAKMGATLAYTADYVGPGGVNAYTLTDEGTWITVNETYSDRITLLAERVPGETNLFNPYGVIPVNPILHPHVNYVAACRFVGFLTSPYGQNLINSYKKYGVTLFTADFGECNVTSNCPTTDQEIAFWAPFQTEFPTS